jgi:hypothetical protein
MDTDRITFLKADNGIILEMSSRNWDGSGIERYVFPYSDNETVYETLSKVINFVFKNKLEAKVLKKL